MNGIVLGINAYFGDAAACLVQDGVVISAVEEERFNRKKHFAGFPTHAARYCLQQAGVELRDVDVVAINRDARAHLWRKLRYGVRGLNLTAAKERLSRLRRSSTLGEELEAHGLLGFRGTSENVEHHLAHLASAFYVSPFEEALVCSVDGFGDFVSTCWGEGHRGGIRVDGRVFFPHSLGVFYEAMTEYLGFPVIGDEYKVMGLAAYGKPRYAAQVRRLVRLLPDGRFVLDTSFFQHAQGKVRYDMSETPVRVGHLYSNALIDLLGPARQQKDELTERHRDIAASCQAVFEEAYFHVIGCAQRKLGATNLALAGGCAQNSVANGRLREHTLVQNVFVPPAAGDAGGAMGAALIAAQRGPRSSRHMNHAFWGPAFDADEVEDVLQRYETALAEVSVARTRFEHPEGLCEQVATLIAQGCVVGWFQGRMEWGPRALGNRSLLADPRRSDVRELLNIKIKRRESFRPFAPSVLAEEARHWFDLGSSEGDHFMAQVVPVKAHVRSKIPAVTHVDGTARIQCVAREANPLFHQLIDHFSRATGVPMVVNTSFNEQEPIVCRPQEALDCFLRTRMDAVVLGGSVLCRGAAAGGLSA